MVLHRMAGDHPRGVGGPLESITLLIELLDLVNSRRTS